MLKTKALVFEKQMQIAEKITTSTQTGSDSVIYLQTVVHSLYNTAEPLISDEYIEKMIDTLNLYFSGEIADRTRIHPLHASRIVDSKIRFCLANTDPNGELTNGIVNTFTNVEWFDLDDTSTVEALKLEAFGGSQFWDLDQYFNIWIAPMTGPNAYSNYGIPKKEYLPLAPFLEDSYELLTHDLIHGAVVDLSNYTHPIGNVFAPMVNVLAHECGHALGLMHTFGPVDASVPACDADDFILDTPLCGFEFNCESSEEINSCIDSTTIDEPDNVSNIMNYSCMQMFTPMQIEVMRNNIENDPSAATQSAPCQILSSVLGDNSFPDKDQIQIYPNPNNGNFTVELSDQWVDVNSLKIFDLNGKLIIRKNLKDTENTQLNISSTNLKAGLHILVVETNNQSFHKKIITH